MDVRVSSSSKDTFYAEGWNTQDWLAALQRLRKELRAAATIFPELRDMEILATVEPSVTKRRK